MIVIIPFQNEALMPKVIALVLGMEAHSKPWALPDPMIPSGLILSGSEE
jgi:hypothetical protein